MGFTWVSTEARTGRLIADLPLLTIPSVKASVGRYETPGQAELPIDIDHAPDDWQRATKKNSAHLILLTDNPNDPTHGIPIWGARIQRRTLDESDTAKLDLATVESYLDARYVGDKSYTGVGQNDIVADLINSFILDGAAGKNGLPIRVQYVTAGVGTVRTRNYADQDDKTIYSVLQDLMGVIGGPEWWIGWEWQFNPERITPVLYVGDRAGTAAAAGYTPNTTFDLPGNASSFQLIEDFTTGKGATDVLATSTGSGTVRPQSSHQVIIDNDQPNVEYRWTPSTSIIDTATLDAHAQTAVTAMHYGSTACAITAFADRSAQFGVDWFLGDDVGFTIGGKDQRTGRDIVPAFPGGVSGVARAIGMELTLDNTRLLTPTLISPTGAFNVG